MATLASWSSKAPGAPLTIVFNSPGECGYTRRVDVFKPVIAAVNGYAFAAGLETALLADIRIAAENAEFGALERRWNIVGGDGILGLLGEVRLPPGHRNPFSTITYWRNTTAARSPAKLPPCRRHRERVSARPGSRRVTRERSVSYGSPSASRGSAWQLRPSCPASTAGRE